MKAKPKKLYFSIDKNALNIWDEKDMSKFLLELNISDMNADGFYDGYRAQKLCKFIIDCVTKG